MSSRQLRKLQQQRELEQARLAELQPDAGSEESEEEATSLPQSKPKPSLFASFAALENEGEDEDEDGDSGGEKGVKETHDPSDLEDPPATVQKKPKKSKKKKKAKAKAKEEAKPTDHVDQSQGPDEIDAALAALKIKAPNGQTAADSAAPVDQQFEKVCRLLGISTQHLKVANEMRNLFGRAAVENHDDAGGAIPRGARRRQRGQNQQVDLETALKGHHAPGRGLPELTLRRNIFIQGKEEWPRASTGGLTMGVIDNSSQSARRGNGVVEFRFIHDQTYQALQQQFDLFVEMGNPQNLIGLLQRNPYHISLLVQVSKIAKDQGDHALSSDLLERALFSFARSSTSLFATKLSQGKAYLDFRRPENRELWLAGYQYIKSLVMKGTYRTAFEWAKLLFSLDPIGDPYRMGLVLHNLALKSHESQWLLDTTDCFDWQTRASHTYPSLAFAAMQLKDGAQCRALLEAAMEDYPWIFTQLFQEINLDAPSSIWGIKPRTDAETLFTEIYVRQTKDLWNTPEATSILMEVAHAINKVDVSKLPLIENKEITLDVVRFVYLDNTPALMGMVPSAMLHRSNNSDADPLPPDDNIYSYESQRTRIEGHGRPGASGVQGDFFDPIAALGRLIPRFGRNPETGEDDLDGVDGDDLRRQLEHAVAAEEEQEATRDPDLAADEQPAQPSIARRLLALLWRPSQQLAESDSYSDHTDTESDEDMPPLEDVRH
ncbi:nulp1-pending protein [Phlyctema vagabunda]|uniref:Nulp1-pending protein n=1 Tax=Phlyctema vagabunda TaxID=108571 RepID=A0ABR4PBZ1_9HELO